jgi:hypothetical protein
MMQPYTTSLSSTTEITPARTSLRRYLICGREHPDYTHDVAICAVDTNAETLLAGMQGMRKKRKGGPRWYGLHIVDRGSR